MSAAAAWRWCLAAGLIAFACSWGFGRIAGMHACGDVGDWGPILAFEFARTPADIARLFGDQPCRAALVSAQQTGLWLDALGFIPSYTAFLCFAAWATGARWRRWIVGALLVAALADEIEGVMLLALLRHLSEPAALLSALFWPVHLKFLLLGLATLAIGSALFVGALTRKQAAGYLGLAVAIAAANAVFKLIGGGSPAMTLQFTIAWFSLLAVAAIGAFWPRLLSSRLPAPAFPSA